MGLSPFADDDVFDPDDAFVPEHVPEPGPFLADHRVLDGEKHVAFHRLTHELFEARTVYDVTFGYNLARLNLDTRHPEAGYRYAEENADVLRAEFTPTTEFCPQTGTLSLGSFRAWNGLRSRHDYDLVRVRVHPMHQEAPFVNDRLSAIETRFEETGSLEDLPERIGGSGGGGRDGSQSPF
ncbi:hypothetical protein VB779_15140 [Haloarculaceae archaeon H-GB11]|nr:hypothetical protein [Haloarculaceae archaeon H-GB11]